MTEKPNLSKDLQELILAIGNSKSKQEEDNIMSEEQQLLKEDLLASDSSPQTSAELMIRTLYLHLLGFDPSFAFIYAINLSQSADQRLKRLGYLVCSTCIPHDSQLLILLVSSMQKDLTSSNPLSVTAALVALSKLSTPTMLHALVEIVTKLLQHNLPTIKSKAAAVLIHFCQLEPSLINSVEPLMHKFLRCDDLTCVMVSLHFYEMLLRRCESLEQYKFLILPLSTVIRGLANKHVGEDYNFHGYPAPWIQIQAMRVIGLIGDADPSLYIQVANVLLDAMRRASAERPMSWIGRAVVYQAHLTAARLKSCDMVLSRSSETLSEFVESGVNNMIYAGVTGLMKSIKYKPAYILRHQFRILDYLEDSDLTLRNGTIKVLVSITCAENVGAITEKLFSIVRKVRDEFFRLEIIQNLALILEMYSPNAIWKFDMSVELLSLNCKSGKWAEKFSSKLLKLIYSYKDTDPDTIRHALLVYTNLLLGDVEDQCPDLLKTAIWTIGEFSTLLIPETNQVLLDALSKHLSIRFEDSYVTKELITALQKMFVPPLTEDLKSRINDCAASRDVDIQQRCYEFARLSILPEVPKLHFQSMDLDCGQDLSFLEDYSNVMVRRGARQYSVQTATRVADRLQVEQVKGQELRFSYGQKIEPKLVYKPVSNVRKDPDVGSLLGRLWGHFRRV